MNTYLPLAEAQITLQQQAVLTYPHAAENSAEYLAQFDFSDSNSPLQMPSKLFSESLHVIGREPKRVLDAGGGGGRHALLLAELGHIVTLTDTDADSLDEAREAARSLGIPSKQLTIKKQDMRELTNDDVFDVVISSMALHFLAAVESRAVLRVMQAATAPGGTLVVDAYTNDNPSAEQQRGIRYMYRPRELGALLITQGWRAQRNVEGRLPRAVQRSSVAGTGMVLIPTVAEVIASKNLRPSLSYMYPNGQLRYAD